MVIGPLIGAVAGFAYYKFIGCASGACPITSNPWISTVYGAIMGFMLATINGGRSQRMTGVHPEATGPSFHRFL